MKLFGKIVLAAVAMAAAVDYNTVYLLDAVEPLGGVSIHIGIQLRLHRQTQHGKEKEEYWFKPILHQPRIRPFRGWHSSASCIAGRGY